MTYELIALLYFASLGLGFIFSPKQINLICLLGLCAFPLAMLGADQSYADMLPHLIAGSVALAIGFTLYKMGNIGGGTAKALALAALWLPTSALFHTFTTIGITGGALALIAVSIKPYEDKIMSYAAAVFCAVVVGIFYLFSPMGPRHYQMQHAKAMSPSPAEAPDVAARPPALRGPAP